MSLSKKQLLKFAIKQNPAKFCFIIYDLLVMPEKCHISGENNKTTSFIFKFLNHYVFYGSNCFKYFNEIPRKAGIITVAFDPENLSAIQRHFQDFICGDKSGEEPFNYFLNMTCNKSQFRRDLKIKIENIHAITLENWTNNAPLDVKNLLKQSITCFGLVQNDKLITCAPSPNLYLGDVLPKFAIIRGVWTDTNYREKGLASAAMKKLCLNLYDEKKVENIYLWVEQRNPVAINIYKKLGFNITGKWWGAQCNFR